MCTVAYKIKKLSGVSISTHSYRTRFDLLISRLRSAEFSKLNEIQQNLNDKRLMHEAKEQELENLRDSLNEQKKDNSKKEQVKLEISASLQGRIHNISAQV